MTVTLCYTDAAQTRRWFWADDAGQPIEIAGQEFFNSQTDAINFLDSLLQLR